MSMLNLDNVSFSYKKDKPLFRDVSFKLSSDERLALCAPSGYGKSTLCQIIAGYLKPDSGRVLLDGKEFAAHAGTANPVQLIWQHPQQVMNPYLRIRCSLEEAGAPQRDMLYQLGIQDEWLQRFPHELSGGQLQRCCLARCLAVKPKFIIADEISTMLDAITQAQIWNYLLDYCQLNNVGLLFVTHSQSLRLRLATRTIKLTDFAPV